MRLPSLILLVACTGGPDVTPPKPDPVPAAAPADADAFGSYTLRFPNPGSQYIEVELVLPSPPDALELRMAAWTPGSYKIRDYARNIDQVEVRTQAGEPVPSVKRTKDTWTIDVPEESGPIVARYRLHASELSVRANWVEPDFAVLNGAATYLVPVGHEASIYDVRIMAPDAWTHIDTALPAHPSTEPNRFRVAHYDTLVDSPILMGANHVTTWTIADPADASREITHRLVHGGVVDSWDKALASRDTERIAREVVAFWGGIPYARYDFLNVIAPARGGLEHKASTLMIAKPFSTRTRTDHTSWLGLVSHEFFHTWNVKRLRPEGLGPFDLSTETYTPSLWVAEGLTSYYDDLLLVRAGLITEDEYLGRMSKNIQQLHAKPGRMNRSVEDASHDAWIKYYNRDANHDNVSISYYVKGAVVGWLLDAEIRDKSAGWKSLDDAMRVMYTRHSGEAGFTAQDMQKACEEVAGESLEPFFSRYVRGTDELDYEVAHRVWGLKFADAPEAEDPAEADGPAKDPEGAWMGVSTNGSRVSKVVKDGPAWNADILVGDEIIAVDDYRVAGGLGGLLDNFDPQTEVRVTLSRHGRMREARLTLGARPDPSAFRLQVDPQASIEARESRKQWWASALGESAPAAEPAPTEPQPPQPDAPPPPPSP